MDGSFFIVHLAELFQPLNLTSPQDVDANHDQLSQALQMDLPITPTEVANVIAKQNPKKAQLHDTICNSTLKATPPWSAALLPVQLQHDTLAYPGRQCIVVHPKAKIKKKKNQNRFAKSKQII